jgi:hypothetical protein
MSDELLDRAYRILARNGPLSCSELGWALWGKPGARKGGRFCRPAGKALKRLLAQGRVASIGLRDKVVWKATPSGVGNGKDFTFDGPVYKDLA